MVAFEIPDLNGKTGATSGLGLASALELVKKGARVLIHGRDETKAKSVVETIKEATGKTVEYVLADLSDLSSVKAMSAMVLKKVTKLDILLLNAGLGGVNYGLTKDGVETTFGVNHLAHFYLVMLLEKLLKESGSRIVSVSSGAVLFTYAEGIRPTLESNNDEKSFDSIRAYGSSKLANVLFTKGLTEKWPQVTAIVVEPGLVTTGFQGKMESSGVLPWLIKNVAPYFGATPANGALTQIYACVIPGLAKGSAYKPTAAPWDVSGVVKEGASDALWTLSESILKSKNLL